MSSRRLDISSLLCNDDAPPPRPPSPPCQIVPDPVVLAPHLRGNHTLHHNRVPNSLDQHAPSSSSSAFVKPHRDHSRDLVPLSLPPTMRRRTPSPTRVPLPYTNNDERDYHRHPADRFDALPHPSSSLSSYPYPHPSPSHSPIAFYRQNMSHSPSALSHSPSDSHFSRPQYSPPHSSLHLSPAPSRPSVSPTLSTHVQSYSSRPSISPTLPKPQSPYVGLEALVEAASEEHRRLSGGAPASLDLPHTSVSPVESRHSQTRYPHPQAPQSLDDVDHHTRPPKRRRSSSSFTAHPPTAPDPQPEINKRDFRALHDPYKPYHRQPSNEWIKPEPQPTESTIDDDHHRFHTGSPLDVRKRYADSSTARKVQQRDRPPTPPPPAQPPSNTLNVSDNQRTNTANDDTKPKQKRKTSGRAQPAQSSVDSRVPERGNPRTDRGSTVGGRDDAQDAHEWFLEHYGDEPLSHTSPSMPHFAAYEGPATTFAPHPSKTAPALIHVPAPAPAKSKRARTPEEEVVSALDRELEEIAGVLEHPPPVATDPTLDADLDLVIESAARTPEEEVSQPVVSMEVDVEDELLSLVDDRPLPAPRTHPHPYSHTTHTAHANDVQVPAHSPSLPAPEARKVPVLSIRHLSLDSQSQSQSLSHPRSPHVPASVPSTSTSPFPAATSAWPLLTPTPERGSMPPPTMTTIGSGATKGSKGATAKKKKEPAPKAPPKPKQPAKSRAKPKPKAADDSAAPSANKKGLLATAPSKKSASASLSAVARSRSTSAMPGSRLAGSVGPEDADKGADGAAENGEEDEEDDKLYCVCKTRYDEDRVMIACDRCDEWYHTQCVNMPDLEVDLVDQFICPPCIESNLQLALCTTYKRRCLFGLKQADPSAPGACHRPARGAFSKYCSDECGVKYMQLQIDAWTAQGGRTERLWEVVRGAERREGVVVCVDEREKEVAAATAVKDGKGRREREVARVRLQLEAIAQEREARKGEMEVVLWRERLVEVAAARAEGVDECGWDQRLCFGDEEWAEFGASVLESYEESGDGMQVDGAGEWWCRGKKKCERHGGWQKLRAAEVAFEKEMMEAALTKLTTKEREIRKRIEDVLDTQGRTSAPSKQPLGTSNSTTRNGVKAQPNGVKKGKKRKAQV